MSDVSPAAGSVAWVRLYREDDLINSPSRADGISLQDELKERASMVDHIVALGKRLLFPEVGIATACVYFHHYYMRNSLKQHDVFHVSSACLHLASKAEDCRRFPRDIVTVTWSQRNPHREVPHKETHEYKNLVNAMLGEEVRVLQALEYSFATVHPNRFALAAVKKLFADASDRDRRDLCHLAWSLGNQSFRSPLCMFYPPQHIGLAIVELAVRWHAAECAAKSAPALFTLPANWIDEFDTRVPVSVLSTISSNILSSLTDAHLAKRLRGKEHLFSRRRPAESAPSDASSSATPNGTPSLSTPNGTSSPPATNSSASSSVATASIDLSDDSTVGNPKETNSKSERDAPLAVGESAAASSVATAESAASSVASKTDAMDTSADTEPNDGADGGQSKGETPTPQNGASGDAMEIEKEESTSEPTSQPADASESASVDRTDAKSSDKEADSSASASNDKMESSEASEAP